MNMDVKRFFLQHIKIGVVLVLFTPLLVGPIGISFSEYPKALFFRVLIEVLLIFYLLLLLKDRRYLPKNSLLLWTVIGFVGALFISGVFGFNFERSFFGDFERSAGIILYLHLLAFFVILSGVFKSTKEWFLLFRWVVGISGITSFVVLLQKLNVFHFYSVSHGAASTLSNPSLFGSYLVIVTFLTLVVILKEHGWRWRTLWAVFLFGNLTSLFLTGSRAAWLGFGIGAIFFLLIAGISHLKRRTVSRKRALLIFFGVIGPALILLGSFFLFTSVFENRDFFVFRLSTISTSLQSRVIVWETGLQAVKERPFLGWGLESFSYVFDTHHKYASIDDPVSPRISFDRPHNKLIGILVSSGIIGFILYLSIFGIVLHYLFYQGSTALVPPIRLAFAALFIAYFIQSLFIFDSVTSAILFFFLLAFMSVAGNKRMPEIIRQSTFYVSRLPLPFRFFKKAVVPGTIGAIIFLVATLYFLNFNPLRVNILIVKGTTFEPQEMGKALVHYQKAIEQDTLYADDFKVAIAERLLHYFEAEWAKPAQFQMIGLLSGIEETLEKKLRVPDKINRNYYILLSGIKEKQYFLFQNPQRLKEIQEILKLALKTYPNHTQFYRMLGQMYILDNDYEIGEAYFQKWFEFTTRKFPEYKLITYYKALGGTYFKAGEKEIAAANFKKALDVEYEWAKENEEIRETHLEYGFTDEVARFYFIELNDANTAVEIYEHALEIYPERKQPWFQERLDALLAECCG